MKKVGRGSGGKISLSKNEMCRARGGKGGLLESKVKIGC